MRVDVFLKHRSGVCMPATSRLMKPLALANGTRNIFGVSLHHGRSYDGRLLTPVFPYNHTTLITRDDADALFAYLISLPPVEQRVPAHDLRWPYGTQAALAVWRSLNFKPAEFKAAAHQS